MAEQAGRLEAIWIKRAKLGPMDPVSDAVLVENQGIKNNADQGRKRQVTIIAKERWEQLMVELGADEDPAGRRANMMVSGIDLANSRGKILAIGEARIKVWGETRPCERMDELVMGLREAMSESWGGGAFGIVLKDAHIAVGDAVYWTDEEH